MKAFNNTQPSSSVYKALFIIVAIFIYLSGCKTESSIKSRSIGAPGELLIVMDKDIQQSPIKSVLVDFAKEEFPCIPQPEPIFRLTIITPNDFEGHFKAYRNILIVKQNQAEPAVKYKNNLWASHQQVVEINAADETKFKTVFEENRTQVLEYLYYGDIRTLQKANLKGADAATQRFVNDKYGVNIVLPKGYKLIKDTANFSWFRFDRLETALHVVIHTFDLDSVGALNSDNLIELRNYVGETYIPGPSETTFMQTETQLPVLTNRLMVNGIDVIELRGLWKVEGFFMGGPFVSYCIPDLENNKLLLIDGFVYAPQKQNKAYYVRQMESILHSVKNI
ncbi:DUF4837 family protein [Labilibacter marinus]|uniref:DUF4837 family protein n=1 Tax=Labilibacter marinus TaxID=1477105 RepID=UPI00094F71BC|nr:DUF4837 family protein [Labilibacter marinus]